MHFVEGYNMQINLRKASAVQAEIRKAIAAIKLETTVNVSEFTGSIVEAVNVANQALLDAVKRKEQLNAALYEIRAVVGRMNAQVGIGDVLADVEKIDGQLTIINSLVTAQEAKSVEELMARVDKLKAAPSDSVRHSLYADRYSTVETGVLTAGTINTFKAQLKSLKRERQDLQDKLLNLNVATTITLSADTVTVLKEEGIL